MSAYAVNLALGLGYLSEEFHSEVALASQMFKYTKAVNESKVPERTQKILAHLREGKFQNQMSIQEAAELIRFAHAYAEEFGVVTGSFIFDIKQFDSFQQNYRKAVESVDHELLERSHQLIKRTISGRAYTDAKNLAHKTQALLERITDKHKAA